jgi:hypothetical protein
MAHSRRPESRVKSQDEAVVGHGCLGRSKSNQPWRPCSRPLTRGRFWYQ